MKLYDKMRSVLGPQGGISDVAFFDYIRTQPFSSTSYLRGMLIAGTSTLAFYIMNLLYWRDMVKDIGPEHTDVLGWLHFVLVCQVVVNTAQIPSRLGIHMGCHYSSVSEHQQASVEILRRIILSEAWLFNRLLSFVCMLLGLVQLCIAEIVLYSYLHRADTAKLRGLVIALSATTSLTFITRIIFAIVFSTVLSDCQGIQGAIIDGMYGTIDTECALSRGKGFLERELDTLETMVYSSDTCILGGTEGTEGIGGIGGTEELVNERNNEESDCCSICLAEYDNGELMICLSCNNKAKKYTNSLHRIPISIEQCTPMTPGENKNLHTTVAHTGHRFHACCIREWLKKESTCPLCKTIVSLD